MIRLSRVQTAAALIFPVEAALAAAIWRLGPAGPIPVHFDMTGAVDRYGTRTDLAVLTGGLTVLGAACWLILEGLRRRADPSSSLLWAQIVVLLVFGLLGALFAYMAFGHGAAIAPMAAVSLLMLGVGAFLGKAGPNPVVGVRTFWSLNSRRAWEKSNRLAGRLLFWIGLTGLVLSPVAPQPLGFQAVVAAVIVSAAAAVFESWRVWRMDPDRRGA